MAPRVQKLTVAQFADLMGLSAERIRQFIRSGMPHRQGARGAEVVPREAIQWIRERDREETRSETAPDEATERARKLRAEADIKEIDREERRGALIPVAIYQDRLDATAGGFAAVAAGQLQRFERDIVRAETPADARKITQQIHAALMRGAHEYADTLDAEAAALEQEPDAA